MAANHESTTTMSDEASGNKPVPYHRYAFHNVYNYSVLLGAASASLMTGNWWLLVLGTGVEALWMVFAPDSRLLRRAWFDKMHTAAQANQKSAALRKKLNQLPASAADRVLRLGAKRFEIRRLCQDNAALTGRLLEDELGKLDKLSDDFADLALSTHRYERYLSTVDWRELEEDLRRQESLVERSKDEAQRSLAQRSFAILNKRKEKLSEIKSFMTQAKAQMELIEHTFGLLTDQVVSMRSPQELNLQLDELIDGVEAVRSAARETESFLEVTA